jgi:hypothetical protein
MSERCRSVDFKQQADEPIIDTLRMKRVAGIDSPARSNFLAGKKRLNRIEQPGGAASSLTGFVRSSSVTTQYSAMALGPIPGSFRRRHEANSRRADKADQRCSNNRHQNDAHSLSPKSDGSVVPDESCVGSLARNWHEPAGAIHDAASDGSNTVFTKQRKGSWQCIGV